MRVFLAVGGLVWGSCDAPGDSRDAKGCLITAACGVFIRPGSDGVGGAYSYSTHLPLEGEGGAGVVQTGLVFGTRQQEFSQRDIFSGSLRQLPVWLFSFSSPLTSHTNKSHLPLFSRNKTWRR